MNMLKRNGLRFDEVVLERQDESFSVAKELVEKLFFELCKVSTKYSNELFRELPYTFSERVLDSVLLPCLSKLCNSMVLTELPAKRCCSNRRFKVDETTGRVDYWCIYKNYSFVIELKHSFDCFTTRKTREKKVVDRWMKMNEQLDAVKDEIKNYEERTNGVVRMGLHLITSYADKAPSKELVSMFSQSIPNMFERFSRDLSRRYPSLRPDVMVCWRIPMRIVLEDEFQTFPGLWLMAKIYPSVNHFGSIR